MDVEWTLIGMAALAVLACVYVLCVGWDIADSEDCAADELRDVIDLRKPTNQRRQP